MVWAVLWPIRAWGGLKPRPSDLALLTLHLPSSFPGPFALRVGAFAPRMRPCVCLADSLAKLGPRSIPRPSEKAPCACLAPAPAPAPPLDLGSAAVGCVCWGRQPFRCGPDSPARGLGAVIDSRRGWAPPSRHPEKAAGAPGRAQSPSARAAACESHQSPPAASLRKPSQK